MAFHHLLKRSYPQQPTPTPQSNKTHTHTLSLSKMLEETASAIPSSIWASMNSWFTPTVLFLLLNLMIATIVFTSTSSSNQKQQQQNHSTHIARSPSSLLHRLKSLNIYASHNHPQDSSLHHKQNPDSDTHSTVTYHLDASQVEAAHFFFPPHTSHETAHQPQTHFDFEGRNSTLDGFERVEEEEEEEEEEDRDEQKSMDEVYSQLTGTHFNRTKSDTKPASGEIPPKLPTKMRKSASVKSAFAHFEEEEIVEARRPATVRERGNAQADEGVDAKADDFINRFKQQLKLQRLDSIIRYKDMIGRGR